MLGTSASINRNKVDDNAICDCLPNLEDKGIGDKNAEQGKQNKQNQPSRFFEHTISKIKTQIIFFL